MRLLAQCGLWVDRYLPVRKTIRQVDSLGYREGRGAGHALRLANHEEAEVCDHIVVCRPPTTPLVLPEAFQTYVSSPV